MNFIEIERLKVQVSAIAPRLAGLPKISLYNYFYSQLLTSKDSLITEAYSSEFIDDYCKSLKSYSPFYSSPQEIEKLLQLLDNLKHLKVLREFSSALDAIANEILVKRSDFYSLLNNSITNKKEDADLSFPLIGRIDLENAEIPYSSLEKIKIKISIAKTADSFLFIPSSYKNEHLQEQAKTSFELAIKIIGQYKSKLSKHHEVLIYFENLSAEYDGISFGVALTIGLIEQLSLFYNLPYLARIKEKIASTGGVDNLGNIISVGNASIIQKVETVFYSDIKTFILPKTDESAASEKLTELIAIYPERKLRLIAVESLTDLLERRNLVGLKKQSKIIRTARGVRRNWLTSILSLLMVLILLFMYLKDFDDNPYLVDVDGQNFLIKNKSGKVLWKKNSMAFTSQISASSNLGILARLIDINNDGNNEVLLSGENFGSEQPSDENNRISCYNKKGDLIWKYVFKDEVSSLRDTLSTDYSNPYIIDILNRDKNKILYLSVRHGSSFASAIFSLELRTGNRVGNTLWNSGHIGVGKILDIDNDGKEELIYIFTNNGMKRCGIAVISLDDADGQGPTSNNYLLTGINIAKFKTYILVPQTDFSIYKRARRGAIYLLGLIPKWSEKKIYFNTVEDNTYFGPGLDFALNYDLKKLDFVPDDSFVGMRDELVKEGVLNPPYTDTKEYMDLIRSQILYWNGTQFVKKDALK